MRASTAIRNEVSKLRDAYQIVFYQVRSKRDRPLLEITLNQSTYTIALYIVSSTRNRGAVIPRHYEFVQYLAHARVLGRQYAAMSALLVSQSTASLPIMISTAVQNIK